MRPKFWSVSLYGQRVQRYRSFYNSPLTTMLNSQKKNKKICLNLKILNVTILLTILVETLPRSIHEFGGANLVCTFRGDVV